MAQAVSPSPSTTGVPSSRLGHSMWVSWWTKRSLGRFLLGVLPFSLTTNFIPPFLHTHLIHFVSFHSSKAIELIFNPYGEFRWSPEGPVSQIHSPHLHAVAPGIFSNLVSSVQMLKREWGAESNGKLPHLSIHNKTAAFISEFTVEDLPLSRNAALIPEFTVKDLPLGRKLWWWYKFTTLKYVILIN